LTGIPTHHQWGGIGIKNVIITDFEEITFFFQGSTV
jgi:hypothetical protein